MESATRIARSPAQRARRPSALPPEQPDAAAGESAETPKEKADRQLLELFNELRVALPGAQFLFAFLLTVPFATRFGSVQHGQRLLFYGCLLCTLLATILLMAPTAYHRVRWQSGDKPEVIRMAHLMFLAGMLFLALAMTAAVCFVSVFLLGAGAAAVATTVSAVALGLTWLVLPLLSRRRARAEGKRGRP